jgi:hypothetical protein
MNEHVEVAGRERPTEHLSDAQPDGAAGGQRRDDVDAADVAGIEPGRLDARPHALGALAVELLLLKRLAPERLDDAQRPDGLLRDRGDLDSAFAFSFEASWMRRRSRHWTGLSAATATAPTSASCESRTYITASVPASVSAAIVHCSHVLPNRSRIASVSRV